MFIVDKVILYFFPHLMLNTVSASDYFQTERQTARWNFITSLPLISLVYILHYFFFDKPIGLAQESSFWLFFRFGMATLGMILGFIYYSSSNFLRLFSQTPAAIYFTLIIGLQAKVCELYPAAPYLYPFVFTLLSIFILRLTVIGNIIFTLINLFRGCPPIR